MIVFYFLDIKINLYAESGDPLMENSRTKEKKAYFFRHFLSTLIVISVIFLCSDITLSATKYYYYLHTSSFRIKKDTIKFMEKLQKHGYQVVAKYKKIGDQGHWYMVYVGPISSKKEVNLTIRSLREKKLARYIAVHQKRALISSDLKTKKKAVDEKATKAKKSSAPVSYTKMTELPQRGIGRNMAQGEFALCYQHLYREVGTELTKRKQITSLESSTVEISDSERNDFPTLMHMDSLRFRYGFTDYLEIFLQAGGGYKELSTISFVYGGGLQLSLFEVERGVFKGFYSSLSGAYLSGDVEYEFESSAGNKWNKEAEFNELSVRGELGIIRSWFAVYLGGVFLKYDETTRRDKLTGLGPLTSFIYEDELENENSFGGFAGVEIYLTPSVLAKVEGQVVSQKSIFVTLEYHF
jgi:SPOR domain